MSAYMIMKIYIPLTYINLLPFEIISISRRLINIINILASSAGLALYSSII